VPELLVEQLVPAGDVDEVDEAGSSAGSSPIEVFHDSDRIEVVDGHDGKEGREGGFFTE